MMAFQMVGQAVAVGLGKSRQAIFFSVDRNYIIVLALGLILPMCIVINAIFII